MLSSFWTALALLKAKHLYLLVLPSVNECLNCIIQQFLEMAHKHWLFREGLSFKNGQLFIPSLSQLQNKTLVALCMRLSSCKYGTEKQVCAYQIVLVTLQPLSLLQRLFLSLGLMVTLFLFQSLLMLVCWSGVSTCLVTVVPCMR